MNYPLSIFAFALAVTIVVLTIFLRRRIVGISFLHYKWMGPPVILSFIGFIIFLLSEVVELIMPIEELENSFITLILVVFTARGLFTLMFLVKYGGSAES